MKKRDLTPQEREEWLIENGQKPAPSRPEHPLENESVPVASSRRNRNIPLEVGPLQGLDKKRAAARPEAILDLHGMSEAQAHKRLDGFMHHATAHGYKTVLIVTGKGKGILREAVPKWLDVPSLRPFILAVNYATPKEGGAGALRVLLKKRKP